MLRCLPNTRGRASLVALAALAVASSPWMGAAVVAQPPAGAPRAEGVAKHAFRWVRTEGNGLALAMTVEPHAGWHLYWKNPGDSGDAPGIELTLPEGWSAGPTVFLRPEAEVVDDSVFYGYSRPVTYLVPVRPGPQDGRPQPNATWRVSAKVMACKGMCVIATLTGGGAWPPPTGDGAPVQLSGGSFEGRSLPLTAESAGVTARVEGRQVTIEGSARNRRTARFIPDAVPGMQVTLPEGKAALEGAVDGDRFRIRFTLETPGEGVGQPAVAGLVLLGNEPADPCVWLSVPQPTPAGASGSAAGGASTPPGPSK